MLIQDKGNHIAVVELFAGVGGFRIGLEVHRMLTRQYGTTNGSLQQCIRTHRWYLGLVLELMGTVTKTSVQNIGKCLYRFIYEKEPVSTRPIDMKRDAQPKLSFDLFADIDVELKVNAPKKTI